jgi:uncharacterized protein YggE
VATIKVRGSGTVTVGPDEAVVTFEVASIADAPAEAFAEAGRRAAALDAVLDEAGIDPQARSTLGVSLHEHQEFDGTRGPRRTHRASTVVSVRLADADAIPPLLQAAVEQADAYLRGPFWRRSDTSAAEAEACRLAIADAAHRANAYAEALGSRVGRAESVEEQTGWSPYPGPAPLRALTPAPPPEVYPAELTVTAVVDVVYALEPA